jgi:tRNA pseudouridine13 synthase
VYPRLTSDLPPVGGAYKVTPEDFCVEEIPAYAPAGVGEHTFLQIEKRGLSTHEAVARLARALGADPREAGTAGLKDKQALARQWISLARVDPAAALEVSVEGVRVIAAERHGNKLRTGHLRGNRFTVKLRGVGEGAHERAQAILDRLVEFGLPNYYGEQRFGRAGDNAERARALLRGQLRVHDRSERRLLLSALQSELFNRVLARRIGASTHRRALAGDVLQKVESGGIFVCEDPAVDQPRIDRWEIVPTGPMFGPKMRAPTGEPAELEATILREAELSIEDFARGGKLAEGTRRALAVRIGDVAPVTAAEDDSLIFTFSLPSGSYATVLLAEIIG